MNNKFYGYIIYHECCPVNARFVEENPLRLDRRVNNAGGAPWFQVDLIQSAYQLICNKTTKGGHQRRK